MKTKYLMQLLHCFSCGFWCVLEFYFQNTFTDATFEEKSPSANISSSGNKQESLNGVLVVSVFVLNCDVMKQP